MRLDKEFNRARAPRRTQVYVERRPQPSSAGGGLPPFNWPAALSWTRSSPRRRLPTGDRLGVEPRERRSARAASARPMCGVGLSRCAGLQPTASAPRWRPRPLATHFRATCSPRIGWPDSVPRHIPAPRIMASLASDPLHLLEALPAHLCNGDAHRRAQHRPEAEIFRPGFIFPALAHYAMNIGAFLIEDWATALCHPEFLRRMRSTALASIRLAWSNCPEKTL